MQNKTFLIKVERGETSPRSRHGLVRLSGACVVAGVTQSRTLATSAPRSVLGQRHDASTDPAVCFFHYLIWSLLEIDEYAIISLYASVVECSLHISRICVNESYRTNHFLMAMTMQLTYAVTLNSVTNPKP